MRIRRELLRLIRDHAEKEGVSCYRIAVVCETSQPRAWNLLNGPIELFNSETLIDILARLGFTLDVTVRSWTRPRFFAPDRDQVAQRIGR